MFAASETKESKSEKKPASVVNIDVMFNRSFRPAVVASVMDKEIGGVQLTQRVEKSKAFFGDVLSNEDCFKHFRSVIMVVKTMPIKHIKFEDWCKKEFKTYSEDAVYGASKPTTDLAKRKLNFEKAMEYFSKKSNIKWEDLDISWSNVVQAFEKEISFLIPSAFGMIPANPIVIYTKAIWMITDLKTSVRVAMARILLINELFNTLNIDLGKFAELHELDTKQMKGFIKEMNIPVAPKTEAMAKYYSKSVLDEMQDLDKPKMLYMACYLVSPRDVLQAVDFRRAGRSVSLFKEELAGLWKVLGYMSGLCGSSKIDEYEMNSANVGALLKKDTDFFKIVTNWEKVINSALRSVKRALSGRDDSTSEVIEVKD